MIWILWPLGVGQVYSSIGFMGVLVFGVDDDGAGDLIVPALLATIHRDPEEAEVQRQRRDEIAEEAHHQPPGGRTSAGLRIHHLQRERRLPRRGAAIAPEAHH